jgi:hypothetical protein
MRLPAGRRDDGRGAKFEYIVRNSSALAQNIILPRDGDRLERVA